MTIAPSRGRPALSALQMDGPHGPIGCQLAGSGPPLVLVAGLGSTARLWGDLLGLLARHCTVVAVDNRGVGGSRAGQPFTLERAAEDLVYLADALDLGSVSLLGVSMGGLVAVRTAARFPHRMGRLVVASCPLRSTPSHLRILRFFELVFTRLAPAEAAEALMAFAFGATFADAYPGFVEEAGRLWAPAPDDVPGALAQLAHLREGFDLSADARAIGCPTLVIAGALDPIVPAFASRELWAAIPGARYREVAGAAHSVLAEGGGQLLAEVLNFVLGL